MSDQGTPPPLWPGSQKPRVKIEVTDYALKVTVEGVAAPRVFEYSVPGIIGRDLEDILTACGIQVEYRYWWR